MLHMISLRRLPLKEQLPNIDNEGGQADRPLQWTVFIVS